MIRVFTAFSGYDSQCMALDRLQAAGISRSQQYKMAGNSIVVACMYHIWRKLFIDTEIKTLTLF